MDSFKAFVFGITLAIAIGPIAVLIINRGLAYGFRSGLMSGMGAALADLTYGIVAFTVGSIIVGYLQMNQVYFSWVASAVLILFGVWMLRGSLKAPADKNKSTLTKARNNDLSYLVSTYLLTVVNPLTVVAFVGFSGQLVTPVFNAWQILTLSLAIFLGSMIIQTALACFGASLGKYLQSAAVVRVLNIISSLSIIGFGILGLWQV